ncbi:MAG: hypothetical protein AAF471_03010, partial [Myxococcota bacterium]
MSSPEGPRGEVPLGYSLFPVAFVADGIRFLDILFPLFFRSTGFPRSAWEKKRDSRLPFVRRVTGTLLTS